MKASLTANVKFIIVFILNMFAKNCCGGCNFVTQIQMKRLWRVVKELEAEIMQNFIKNFHNGFFVNLKNMRFVKNIQIKKIRYKFTLLISSIITSIFQLPSQSNKLHDRLLISKTSTQFHAYKNSLKKSISPCRRTVYAPHL